MLPLAKMATRFLCTNTDVFILISLQIKRKDLRIIIQPGFTVVKNNFLKDNFMLEEPKEIQVPRAHGCHTTVLLQAHHLWDESHGGLAPAQTGFACPCPCLPPHPVSGPLECHSWSAVPVQCCLADCAFPPHRTLSASPRSSEQSEQGRKRGG